MSVSVVVFGGNIRSNDLKRKHRLPCSSKRETVQTLEHVCT